jgi:F-type H+-transporting ATPase subunit b
MTALGINLNLLIAQAVNFLVVLILLRLFVYDRLLRMVDERRERIRTGLEEADRVRAEAAVQHRQLERQLEDERRASQEKLRQAVAASEEAARRLLDDATTEAERIVLEARASAENTRRHALAGLHNDMAELALAAAAKALGEGIDAKKHRELIDRFLVEQLGGKA